MYATGATSIALAYNYDAYQLLMAWATRLDECGSEWLRATLGPIDFFPYQAAADFAERAMQMWGQCKAGTPGGGTPGPGTSTDPNSPPTADPGSEPGPPTYLDLVIRRLLVDGYLGKDRQPSPNQAKRAARDCVRAERAARAAGAVQKGEHPCLDDPVFFPGRDAGWAAVHDAIAITEHPEWARLTYLSTSDKKTVRPKVVRG